MGITLFNTLTVKTLLYQRSLPETTKRPDSFRIQGSGRLTYLFHSRCLLDRDLGNVSIIWRAPFITRLYLLYAQNYSTIFKETNSKNFKYSDEFGGVSELIALKNLEIYCESSKLSLLKISLFEKFLILFEIA